MKYFLTRYSAQYPRALVYMLQASEYKASEYLRWFHRTENFNAVMKRQTLVMTAKARLLLLSVWAIWLVMAIAIVAAFVASNSSNNLWWSVLAALLIVAMPYVMAYGVLLLIQVGYVLVQKPRERRIIEAASKKLAQHKGVRIAIAGSYGKTTAKEILLATLSHSKKVRATPGNMNTPIGISRFIQTLDGDEDVLIFELGEERVGDVAELARLTNPQIGIITGINEAHLSSFKSIDQTVATIYELADFVAPEALYQSYDNDKVREAGRPGIAYSREGVQDYKVKNVTTSIEGTMFDLKSKDETLHIQTRLIGEHTIGVTAVAAAIARRLNLTKDEVEAALQGVVPFKHRMEARQLHGAWIIDDTYNGNIDGIKAGLAFIRNQTAKRRIYVTPGLVEQGDKTEEIHIEIGRQIAKSNVTITVLMKNSVCGYIKRGLEEAGFKGELMEIDDPLEFYTNLEYFVAAGDMVLMQNDWPDNYA